jgi:hypothetical protein
MEGPHDQRGVPIFDAVAQDVRYAIRTLRKAPAFSLTAIVTIALGIGATTAVFSLINGVLLRELPVKDPHRLATISSDMAIRQGRARRKWVELSYVGAPS